MNRIRPIIPLGIPQNAAKLVGSPSEFLLSRRAQILATNTARTETVISAGRFTYTNIIDNNDSISSQPWHLRNDVVFAKYLDETVTSAPQGIYRVDIGYESYFVCDPQRIVGTLGKIRTETVYPESRLDVTKTWMRLVWSSTVSAWNSTVSALRRTKLTLSSWLSRVPVPQRVRAIKWPQLSLPQLPPAAAEFSTKLSTQTSHWGKYAAEKTFYLTHSRKLKIQGPCSILIKP